MSSNAKKISVFVAVLLFIIVIPGLTSVNKQAPVVQVQIRQSENILPKILPIVDTTNDASIPVKSVDTKNSAIIQLNGEVNEGSVDEIIDGIRQANRDHKKAIYLLLDSPGGRVFDGSRLIAAMGSSKAPVYTVVTGLCASMCAIITEYGKERYMLDRTTLMFHPASMGVQIQGEVDKIISRLSYSKHEIDKMDVHTAKRSGMTYEAFKFKTMSELWLDSEDALAGHYIDAIVDIDFVKQIIPLPREDNKYKQEIRNLNWE